MLATDTLSLVFIGCFVVSGTFLILSSLLGFGHGQFHLGHLGQSGHAGAGHVGHAGAPGHASAVLHHALPHGHAGTHATHAGAAHQGQGSAQAGQAGPSVWSFLLGFLNLYAIMAFLFWFGLIGYILHNLTNFSSLSAFIGALGVGILGAVLVNYAMSKLMNKDDGELTAETSELVGTIATVSLPIRAGGIGEVIYTKGATGRKSLGARSVDGLAIPREAEVVVVGYQKGIAQVQTWDRFLSENDELESGLRTLGTGDASAATSDVTSPKVGE